MKILKSNPLKNLPFQYQELERVADLINIEEPLLVLFRHLENQRFYLFDWIDCDEQYNRWLIYSCSEKNLKDFVNGKISHKELFWLGASSCYIIDIDRNFEWHNPQRTHKEDLPTECYPSEETFFEVDYCSNVRREGKEIFKKLLIQH